MTKSTIIWIIVAVAFIALVVVLWQRNKADKADTPPVTTLSSFTGNTSVPPDKVNGHIAGNGINVGAGTAGTGKNV